MRKPHSIFLSTLLLLTSCTTLNESLKLGAATGALAGATATYAAESTGRGKPTIQNIGMGGVLGLGIGLITSYFVHKQVVEDRDKDTRQTEIYFGDLPPSPFILPKSNSPKGVR